VNKVPSLTSYPNPFNPRTVFRYRIDRPGHVTLRVYDARGRVVRTLVDGFESASTERIVLWDGQPETGVEATSGVYFALLTSPSGASTTKLVLLK
jgi:flagellar hook assembly protein FlgD